MNAPLSASILSDLIREEKLRRAAEASLYEFVKQAWPTMEPGIEFVPSWHIETICEHLEAVSRGQIQRLLINIPPRSSKSTVVSVAWPMWEWIRSPHQKFLAASYSGSLSTRDNLKARRLVQSPWYQQRWGENFQLSGDQNAKQRFENNKTGYRLATSVGGTATGEGGSRLICLHPDTLIKCDSGVYRIADIVDKQLPVKVLGFDHETNQASFQQIERYEVSAGRPCVRLTTASGKQIVLTHDHPVYVDGKGYVQAGELKHGDRLLRYLRERVSSEAIACGEAESMQPGMRCRNEASKSQYCAVSSLRDGYSPDSGACGAVKGCDLLQSHMPRRVDAPASDCQGRRGHRGPLRSMWQAYDQECGLLQAKTRQNLLFKGMPDNAFFGESTKEKAHDNEKLFDMWHRNIRKARGDENQGHMLSTLCRRFAQQAYERGRQWAIRAWSIFGAVSKGVSLGVGPNQGTGQIHMPMVWIDGGRPQGEQCSGQSSCASHRLQQGQQPARESDFSMPVLSREDAQPFIAGAHELAADFVSSVESAERPWFVYNVAIAKTHNYFAEGILLHNCDDPHGAQDAQSEAMRESALEWFDMVWSTRLNNPKTDAMVTVMQRLHEKDVSGHILHDIGGWEHICIPAEWDGVKRKTVLGSYDPRTVKDELICPARFGPEEIERLKKLLGDYGAAGQLQQEPAPAEGGIINTGKIQMWSKDESSPPMEYILQSYDTAFTEKTSGDPTACTVWGVFRHKGRYNAMLLDAWDEHMAYPQLRAKVLDDFSLEYKANSVLGAAPVKSRKADRVLIEQKGSGQSLLQDLRQGNVPVVGYNPGNADKIARAHQATPIIDRGLVWIPESTKNPGNFVSWAAGFIKQLSRFPVAEHDDYVDTFTQAMIFLKDQGWFDLQRAKDRENEGPPPEKPVNPYAE